MAGTLVPGGASCLGKYNQEAKKMHALQAGAIMGNGYDRMWPGVEEKKEPPAFPSLPAVHEALSFSPKERTTQPYVTFSENANGTGFSANDGPLQVVTETAVLWNTVPIFRLLPCFPSFGSVSVSRTRKRRAYGSVACASG